MSIAVAGSAMQAALRRRVAEDFARKQVEADQAYRQQQAERQASQFDASHGLRLKEFDAERAEHAATEGRLLAEQIPGETFLEGDSPEAKRIPSALLQQVPEIPAMGEHFQGPMQHGATPQDAQRGRKGGFLKTRTQAQQAQADAAAALNADRDADNRRMGLQQEETARHNRAIEGATASNRELSDEMTRLRIQAEKDKQAAAQTERERTVGSAQASTETALGLVDRLLGDESDPSKPTHPGMAGATGAYEMAGWRQDPTDFNAIRDQLVAALALPNLGALKGPMSDKDVIFVKQLATRLSNTRMSEAETRRALAEARAFLKDKLASGAAIDQRGGGNTHPSGGGRVYYDADGNPVQR